MNEIICPNCKKASKVDEAGFSDILKQVRDHEFDKALHKQVASVGEIISLGGGVLYTGRI